MSKATEKNVAEVVDLIKAEKPSMVDERDRLEFEVWRERQLRLQAQQALIAGELQRVNQELLQTQERIKDKYAMKDGDSWDAQGLITRR